MYQNQHVAELKLELVKVCAVRHLSFKKFTKTLPQDAHRSEAIIALADSVDKCETRWKPLLLRRQYYA